MAYRFLGVKLLPGTHHLFLGIGRMFLGTPKLVLGTFWPPGNDPAVPRNAGTVPRNAENQSTTRDTLPWAAYTFHTLGNKVLHKTRCAKDRERSKDTFGNWFEVYWYDADDGVLHEDDWHFKLMRWQLIALYVIIGDSSLSLR